MEDKAKEFAARKIRDLVPSQREAVSLMLLDLLEDAYRNGYWQGKREDREAVKDILHEINHSGWSLESVKLTLEEWVE